MAGEPAAADDPTGGRGAGRRVTVTVDTTAMHTGVFVEDWWLEAATGGGWRTVSVERNGRVEGRLSYALGRSMGFSHCGVPDLTRLLYPVVDVTVTKTETLRRTRFQIETELIQALPRAASYEFILPPDDGSALAWQALGFDARVQHTFVIDAGAAEADLWGRLRNKTRNVIRRAGDVVQPQVLSVEAFGREYARNLGTAVDAGHLASVERIAGAVIARGQGRAVGAVDGHGRVHAAVLFVWDGRDYYYYLSTRDAAHAELGAVALLVWDGIDDARRRGLRFDFDGVSSQSRLRFLQSFGGRLASRIVVTRGSAAYEARLLLRRLRRRLLSRAPVERFY